MFCVTLQKILKVFVKLCIGWPGDGANGMFDRIIGVDRMWSGG